MIPLFSGYALITWWLCCRFRRRAMGFVVALAAMLGLLAMGEFHEWMGRVSDGRLFVVPMQLVLKTYTALVTVVGLYIAVLPRRHPDSACRACGYDLGALRSPPCCPECGDAIEHADARAMSSQQQPAEPTQREHAQRQPHDRRPAQA